MNKIALCFGTLLFLAVTSCGSPQISTEEVLPTSPSTSTSTTVTIPTVILDPTQNLMFSLKTANTVPPTDVLQEVTFYGAGGTGEPRCENPELQIFDWQENLETGCEIYAYGCGWQNNEIVDVTIVYPDGKKKEYQIKAHINFPALDKYASVDIQQRLLVTDPAGLYKIKVQGASGNAEKEISVLEPNGPSAYYYGDALWLQGFMPNESLRLIAYQRVSSGAANSSFVGFILFYFSKM